MIQAKQEQKAKPVSQGSKQTREIKGDTGAQTEAQGLKGNAGVAGTEGDEGDKGDVGPAGSINIGSCYSKTGTSTGSGDKVVNVYCNNPANEFVQGVSVISSNTKAAISQQQLLFTDLTNSSYFYPIGSSVGGMLTSGNSSWTLNVSIFCCGK